VGNFNTAVGVVSQIISSGAGSCMAGMAAAIPIWNLVWWCHTNPMKFGQLILGKIVKIVVTRCKILNTKINFRLGLHPRPRWGSLQHSPNLLAGIKGMGGCRKGETHHTNPSLLPAPLIISICVTNIIDCEIRIVIKLKHFGLTVFQTGLKFW